MGYRKIQNLYKPDVSRLILERKEVYALEKIHGTSAHVAYSRETGIRFFAGGIKHETFMKMFDERFGIESITLEFEEALTNGNIEEVIVYGEAYGGSCQKMSSIYGPLNFIVFEIKLNGDWLSVKDAYYWANWLGLPFVYFEKGPATIEWLNAQRDMPSFQARRNGMGDDKQGEGIVIRSLLEERDHRGNRIIAKHKKEVYGETRTPRSIDPEKQRIWTEARETAEEWCIMERMHHVLDALKASGIKQLTITETGTVIRAMIEDVRIESGVGGDNPEIEWTNAISKAIGSECAKLYKRHLNEERDL